MNIKNIDHEKAKQLRLHGQSYKEIGQLMGIPQRTARYITQEIQLSPQQIKENWRKSKQQRDEIQYQKYNIDKDQFVEYLKTHKAKETCQYFHIGWSTFYHFTKKFGLTRRKRVSYENCQLCHRLNKTKKMKYCLTCVSKIRRLTTKMRAILFKGGKCQKCGITFDYNNAAAFEFHHPNKNEKVHEIGCHLNARWSSIVEEISKCDLLCSNCHRITHSDYGNIDLINIIQANAGLV